jgi:hypothetical protein
MRPNAARATHFEMSTTDIQSATEHGSSRARRYSLAGLSVLATLGVQLVLNPIPTLVIPLLVSLLAVTVIAYFGGRGPALLATGVNFLADWYLFAQPPFSFTLADRSDVWRLAAFAAAGVGVSWVGHRLLGTRHFPRVALLLGSSLLLVIVSVLVWFDLTNSREAEQQVEHTYQALNASEELFATIQDAESRQRNYLLTGQEQYLASYRAALDSVQTARRQVGGLTTGNASQKARLAELGLLIEDRLAMLDRTIVARREQGDRSAIDIVRTGQGAHITDEIRTALNAVNSEEHRLLSQRAKLAAAQAARTRWALAGGTALLVVLLIFSGAIIESDVTKLKSSERMSRRQADLLDKTQGPIIVWELGGAIEYWSRGAEELYGFSREYAVGRNHNDLLRPVHTPGMPAIQELLARDGKWNGELEYLIDGREIVVESRMTLVTEPDGRKTVLKTNRDVTEEKRAQEEIRQLNRALEQRVKERTAQLEAANKELEGFAYSISHDLRAPLRGIDGWSLALLEDYAPRLDAQGLQYLDRVRSETRHMDHLIDDLLQLSHLTRVELRREPVDLSSLARSIVCSLREAEPTRVMDIEIQEGLAAEGDSRLLEILLFNLLSNAVKFTATRDQARIEFGRAQDQTELAYHVVDNGVGFDMAYAGMLFSPFQRLHKQSEFPGTGVGLAIAQRVVRRHGGRIWADARANEGATFYFTIGTETSG